MSKQKSITDPKSIEEFLAMLGEDKWKQRFGKVVSFLDGQARFVLVYLKDLAGKEGKSLEELLAALTVENSERIYNRIVDLLPHFNPKKDERAVFVTAYLLTLEDVKARHTLEWVGKAEKACNDLARLKLCDDLTAALAHFPESQEQFVADARTLLDAEDKSGKWINSVYQALEKLRANMPKETLQKDPAAEADWFKNRLQLELKEVDPKNLTRSGIYEARACLDAYQPTMDWVAEATLVLPELRKVKAIMAANATYKWWTKSLSPLVEQEPVEALKKALDERDLSAIEKALDALKKFNPTCSDPACTKHVMRQGKGPYLAYCEDHVGSANKPKDDLRAVATEEQKAHLRAVLEQGESIPEIPFADKPKSKRQERLASSWKARTEK